MPPASPPRRSPRILLVTQDFPPAVGGIETYAHELARRWANTAAHLVVLAPVRRDTAAAAAAFDRAAPFPVVRTRIPIEAFGLVGGPLLAALIRRHAIDTLFHAQWQSSPSAGLLRRAGVVRQLAIAAHGRELLLRPLAARPAAQRAYDAVRRRSLAAADMLLPVSRYTAGLIQRIGVVHPRVHIVGNGTDPEYFTPGDPTAFRARHGLGTGPDAPPIVGQVGRLVARKGVDDLLRAWPQVRALAPRPPLLLLVGGGPDRPRLEALARALELGDSVRFLGRVPHAELVDAYRACDVFVTASREDEPDVEGFGIVFLEAGACGRPVVGARSGGIPDAIVDGETGLLVPPSAPAALADAVLRLLRDPGDAARLGANGRARVLHSATWHHTADTLLEHLTAGV